MPSFAFVGVGLGVGVGYMSWRILFCFAAELMRYLDARSCWIVIRT